MTAIGFNQPLYILPFDHRGSFETKMFGWQGTLSPSQTAEIAATKQVIYDGFKAAIQAGVPKQKAGILVDEQFGAAILRDAATNMRVTGWNWWRRVIVPGIFPYYVTGGITASGGSWNAAIVAELASWGDTHVQARGLGSYIAEATTAGDFHRIVLGIGTMSLFVVVINRLFWRPLYYYAERKYRMT